MLNAFKQIDYFRKIQQDIEPQKTQVGGIVSCIFFVVFIILIIYQFKLLIFGELIKQPYVVNSNNEERVRVNLNITFHEVSCPFLSIDYQDVTGTHLENIQYDVYKLPLNSDGTFIHNQEAQQIKQLEKKIFYPSTQNLHNKNNEPDSCYGAEMNKGQKCTTCSDVMIAYTQRGWPIPPQEVIAQCQPDHVALKSFSEYEQEQKEEQERQRQLLIEQQELQNMLRRAYQEQQREQQQIIQQQAIKKNEEIFLKQQQAKQEQEKKIKEQQIQNEITKQNKERQEQNQKDLKEQLIQENTKFEKQISSLLEIVKKNPLSDEQQKILNTLQNQLQENKKILDQHNLQEELSQQKTHNNNQQNKNDNMERENNSNSQNISSENDQLILDNNEVNNNDQWDFIQGLNEYQKQHLNQKINNLKLLDNDQQQNKDGETIIQSKMEDEKLIDFIQDLENHMRQSEKQISDNKINFNITQSIVQLQLQDKEEIKQTDEISDQLKEISKLTIYRKTCDNKSDSFQLNLNITGSQSIGHKHEKIQQIKDITLEKNQCQLFYNIYIDEKQNMLYMKNNNLQQILFSYEFAQENEIYELQFSIEENNIKQSGKSTIMFITNKYDQQNQNNSQNINNEQSQNNNQQNRRYLFTEDYGFEHGQDQEFSMQEIQEIGLSIGQGCQIYGHMYLKRVPGNFHISFHGKGLANFMINKMFSLRHTINLLEFTSEKSQLSNGKILKSTNPLDNQYFNSFIGHDQDYYLKIVNSEVDDYNYKNNEMYLFTALQSETLRNHLLPSLTFKYDFDPIGMKYEKQQQNFSHFIVQICAILGGAYSISKFFHSVFA